MSRVPVLPPLRFSGTCLSRPVLSVLHRCPSYVSSTHGAVLFCCSVLLVHFLIFLLSLSNTHGEVFASVLREFLQSLCLFLLLPVSLVRCRYPSPSMHGWILVFSCNLLLFRILHLLHLIPFLR